MAKRKSCAGAVIVVDRVGLDRKGGAETPPSILSALEEEFRAELHEARRGGADDVAEG